MNTNSTVKLPAWFWVAAIAAVVWNALGIAAYLMEVTMSGEALSALPAAERVLYEQMPAWVTGAFAIAVFGGMAGSVALVLRKRWATTAFLVSLVAVLVQMGYLFGVANVAAIKGTSSLIMPAVIIVIAAILVWFSMRWQIKGWLR